MAGVRTSRWWALLGPAALLLHLGGCQRTVKAYPEALAGVGVVLQTTPTGQAISGLVNGGPAAGAGLHVGDRVLAINGESTEGKSLANVVEALRGQPGSQVIVRVRRPEGEVTVTLTRQQLAKNGNTYRVE